MLGLADLIPETIGNTTEYYGEYNFTNLQVESWYRPQVLPVERARDGRCLCPVNGDPYDGNVVCSCIAADSKLVMIPKIIPPTTPPTRRNSSIIANEPILPHHNNNNLTWVFLVILAVLVAVLIIIIYIIIHIYRRYRLSGKTLRIRFVQDVNSAESGRSHMNGSAGHTPLIPTHGECLGEKVLSVLEF
ncbi:hypothetical protein QR680_002915 [Steinernema hermaphroditum]|uniref:ILCR1 Ig-like domain-containing protein n=1 Tax=Steinernema hermaphroditum TaxID=289476 RepID=A0AA39H6F4_9BILA|nr:hypothetical protein QR680_002915 [Steinernema hermaphroditum]